MIFDPFLSHFIGAIRGKQGQVDVKKPLKSKRPDGEIGRHKGLKIPRA